jgi:hypothetical protein
MQSVMQFSVFMVDKPGILAHVCDSLARDKINITAISMMDSNEHGVLRMITEDPAKTRATLRRCNLPVTETEVLMVELPNRPGALADVCARLGTEHISINYAYGTGNAPNGRSLAVLKVSDLPRALKTLDSRKPRRKETLDRRPRMRR